MKTWNSLTGWVAKQWTKVLAEIDPTINVEQVNKNIDKDTERRNQAVSRETLDTRLEREQEINQVEEDRKRTVTAIANMADQEDQTRRDQYDNERKQSEDELRKARQEWQDAIDEARKKREAIDQKDPETPEPPSGLPPAPKVEQAQQEIAAAIPAIQVVQARFDVAGSFNAQAAFGMGIGNSVADRTAKAAEETAKNTKKIAQKMDDAAALVFE